MEVVFFGNLIEATKDLGDNEILFCPLYNWVTLLNDSIGGVIGDNGQVRSPTSKELDSAKDHLLLGGYAYGSSFFYATKPGWVRKHLEEFSEMIKKNEEYLKKEIIEDLARVGPLFEYDLFLDLKISDIANNSESLKLMIENTKATVEGEVRKDLIRVEREKEKKYIEALSKILRPETSPEPFPKDLDLSFVLPPKVRKEGTENYIKEGKIYKEATRGEKKVLMITLPDYSLIFGPKEDEALNGIGIKHYFSKPEIDKDRVYVVLGEFRIPHGESHGESEMTYLFGLPFFKVKISSVNVEFKSKNVFVKRRKETKGSDGVALARLQTSSFLITLEYTKEPEEVIEGEKGKRTIETRKSLQVEIRREDETDSFLFPKEYKVCDIEIKEDGEFSVKTDYSRAYKVQVTASRWAEEEAHEEKEQKEGVSWLIEKWTKGKEAINFGRIVKEDSFDEKKIFVLKEEKYIDEENNKMDVYIKSKLEGLIKDILKEENTEGKKERNSEVIILKPEEHGEIIREIQTGFIQDKVIKNLKYLEKIEELCFESKEGERIGVKHPDLERQEEPIKIAKEAALYWSGISVEKLRGERKSVTEVLKLVSYSFPFLTQFSLKKILEELKEKAGSVLSEDRVPLKDIEVSIKRINPSVFPSSKNPGALALFSIEGDRVKVYINNGEGHAHENLTKYLKIGIGDIDITVQSPGEV